MDVYRIVFHFRDDPVGFPVTKMEETQNGI